VYRSGFARFTIAHFSIKKEDIVNNLVHLTNFSIQKHAPTFKSQTGTKWSATSTLVKWFYKYCPPLWVFIHIIDWSII
jgi:hypothetical protein